MIALLFMVLKILDSGKGLFVAMPNIKSGENRKDIFHPISKESREKLIAAIFAEYHAQADEHIPAEKAVGS